MRQFLMVALVALAALLGTTIPAFADPNLPNIPAHRHFVKTTTSDLVQVGPRLCDNPSLQNAFNQFHVNVHRTTAASQGPAAPGLHNGFGAELEAHPCSFTP
jgi:hypothetical protein